MTLPQLQIFSARSGETSARVIAENGKTLHLHSLVEPEKESRFFPDLQFDEHLVVLCGLGLGYHLRDALKNLKTETPLILLDTFAENIERFKKDFLANHKGEILSIHASSPNAEETIRSFRSRHPGNMRVLRHPASVAVMPGFFGKALRMIRAVQEQKTVTNNKKSVLLFHGNFFLEEELRRACADEGEVTLLSPRKGEGSLELENRLEELLQKCRPDMVLSINLKGIANAAIVSGLCSQYGIPMIIWFVDDPRPILAAHPALAKSVCTVFCWEKSYIAELERQQFRAIHWLPLAGDPSIFSPSENGSGRKDSAIFVGTSMGGIFLEDIRGKFLWQAEMQPALIAAATMLQEDCSQSADQLLEQCFQSHGQVLPSDPRSRTWLRSLCIHTASMLKRKKNLKPLLNLNLEIFGDAAGWKELLGANTSVHAPLDYHLQLREVYALDAVHINITSCQMPTAVNQRVFDIPLSGSFLLSDRQADMAGLFEEGSEWTGYSSPEELREQVLQFQKDPEGRKRIANKARERVLAEHTYVHRLRTIREYL